MNYEEKMKKPEELYKIAVEQKIVGDGVAVVDCMIRCGDARARTEKKE